MYKINLHAHTIFSDGLNTPYTMALKANEIGLSALCITDHYNPITASVDRNSAYTIRQIAAKAKREAKTILPIIRGMELYFKGNEMLVFGSALLNEICLCCEEEYDLTITLLKRWKKEHGGAFILCHPDTGNKENWKKLLPILDGYELYNRGYRMFAEGESRGCLEGLPTWCNSDAHTIAGLEVCYNIVDTKIETEADLIRYIKKRKQPGWWVRESR